MSKIILLILSLILAAFAEWSLVPLLAPYYPPPLLPLTALFWFLHLRIVGRLILGAFVGFLMDSISTLPFGTYTASFFLLGLAVETAGRFILHSGSLLLRAASWLTLALTFLILSQAIGFAIRTFWG